MRMETKLELNTMNMELRLTTMMYGDRGLVILEICKTSIADLSHLHMITFLLFIVIIVIRFSCI